MIPAVEWMRSEIDDNMKLGDFRMAKKVKGSYCWNRNSQFSLHGASYVLECTILRTA